MGGAHETTPTTRGRGLRPSAESDRTSSQQVGQDGQYRWGTSARPIRDQDWRIGQNNTSESEILRKFSPVHHDRPIRSIYDDLAIRVTGLTPVVTPQLPDDPATPTGHTPPPTVPDAVTPTTPGRDTPRRPILQTPPPAPDTTRAPPPSGPDVEPPAPAICQRRSTRATSVPTWHKDYSMG